MTGPGGGVVHLRQSPPGRRGRAALGAEPAEGGALRALPDGGRGDSQGVSMAEQSLMEQYGG